MSGSGYGGTEAAGSPNHAVLLLWHAALGTRKGKHPCLVEAEGWHLQGVLSVSSVEGCVSPPSKTNWSEVWDSLGQSQEWRLGCFCQPKGIWKTARLLLVSNLRGEGGLQAGYLNYPGKGTNGFKWT